MAISLRSLTRSIDAISGLRAEPQRSHGIILDPNTGKPCRRPGRVGDIRHVRIDLEGARLGQYEQARRALDLLYADFHATTPAVIDEYLATLRLTGMTMPRSGVPSQWQTRLDMVLRPIAISTLDDAVSIWAEVDPAAHAVHMQSGRHVFGDVVEQEPRIPPHAIVQKGAELDRMCEDAQTRLAAAQARQAAKRMAARRAHRQRIGVTASFVMLVMAIGLAGLGSGIMTSLLSMVFVACLLGIMHYTLDERRWETVARWLGATHDVPSAGAIAGRPTTPWNEIENAVRRNAPALLDDVARARTSIERLSTVTGDIPDPETISRTVAVTNGVTALIESYRRPAQLALDAEVADLTRDLAESIATLARTADDIRRDALAAARGDFDTQRRYLEARTGHAMLSPVC